MIDRAGCPVCGGPLTIRTDGLLGVTTSSCETCAQRASNAARDAWLLESAMKRVARHFDVPLEELVRRIVGKRRRRQPVLKPNCARCGRQLDGNRRRTCSSCTTKQKSEYSASYYQRNRERWRTVYAAKQKAKRALKASRPPRSSPVALRAS